MLLDIAPLTPQELFWLQVEEYLPVIIIGLLAVAALAVFAAVKLIKKAIDKKEK